MITCPGNANRGVDQIALIFPDYINANIFDKVYLGTVSMFSTILNNVLIYWFMSLLIMLFIVSKKRTVLIKLLALDNLLFQALCLCCVL